MSAAAWIITILLTIFALTLTIGSIWLGIRLSKIDEKKRKEKEEDIKNQAAVYEELVRLLIIEKKRET